MKTELRKVLVPVDFSETGDLALKHAADLAKRSGAELIILHVLYAGEYHFDIPDPSLKITNHDDVGKIIDRKLNAIAESLRTEFGVQPRIVRMRGKVADDILTLAKDEVADLIAMGTHGASGFHEYFAGSNANKIAHLATCPVITYQSHMKNIGMKNIVLPIDQGRHSREKVDLTIMLGKLYNAKINILGLLEFTKGRWRRKIRGDA